MTRPRWNARLKVAGQHLAPNEKLGVVADDTVELQDARNVFGETAAREVPRRGDGQGLHIPNQQLQTFRRDHRRNLQEESDSSV